MYVGVMLCNVDDIANDDIPFVFFPPNQIYQSVVYSLPIRCCFLREECQGVMIVTLYRYIYFHD